MNMISLFLKEPACGDIAFSTKADSGWYSKSVRFFTKSQWSHCFFLSEDYLDEAQVWEIDLKAQLVPFKKEYIEKQIDVYEMFRPTITNKSKIRAAAQECINGTAGETYGFLEIPWFAVRSLLSKIGVHLKENVNKDGVICSEALFIYLSSLGGGYANAFSQFTRDEVSPEDLYKVVKERTDLFEFIGSRSAKKD